MSLEVSECRSDPFNLYTQIDESVKNRSEKIKVDNNSETSEPFVGTFTPPGL